MSLVENSISAKEYDVLASLIPMFDTADPVHLLRVIRKYNCNLDLCIDHLLNQSESESDSDIDIHDYELADSEIYNGGFWKVHNGPKVVDNLGTKIAKEKQQLKKKKKEERKMREHKKREARNRKTKDMGFKLFASSDLNASKGETTPLLVEPRKECWTSEVKPTEKIPQLVDLSDPNWKEAEVEIVDMNELEEDIPEEIYVECSNLMDKSLPPLTESSNGINMDVDKSNMSLKDLGFSFGSLPDLQSSIPEMLQSSYVENSTPRFDENYYIEREKMLLERIVRCEGEISRLHCDNVRLRESKDLISEENTRLTFENDELTKANVQLDDEKRNAMSFFIKQVSELRSQILEQDRQASDMKMEIQNLELQLEESKRHESRLSKMLIQSKDILAEGVSTLSKNLSSGWTKVQSQMSIETDFKILEKLKEFAFNVRDEILKALNINIDQHRIAPPAPKDNLDAFEEEEEQAVKIASLQTYVHQELARNST